MRFTALITPLIAVAVLALTSACSDGGPSNSAGFVQISGFIANPLVVACGFTATNPPKNIGSPDTVLLQVQMVNTTANDVYVTTAGTYGVITTATEPEDVGKPIAAFPSVPFRPSPALLAARIGDLPIRVSLPTEPVCQTKPVGYFGDQNIYVSARMTTAVGQYATIPATIAVNWR